VGLKRLNLPEYPPSEIHLFHTHHLHEMKRRWIITLIREGEEEEARVGRVKGEIFRSVKIKQSPVRIPGIC